MEKMLRAVVIPANALALLSGIAITIMMLQIVADVIGKFVFRLPIANTVETISAYHMVLAVFFPLAFCEHKGGHIIVELFTRRLRGRPLLALEAWVNAFAFAFMAVFTWQGVVNAMHKTRVGEVWETAAGVLTVWPSRWFMPIGCGFLALYLAVRCIQNLDALILRDPGNG